MFGRFTERAQKVLALAQEEAVRLGHNNIGTEHILLGLIREGEGIAAKALIGLGLGLEKIQDEVETLIGHAVGGVCPFAVNEGVHVYLDESLKRFVTVFPACGSGNSAIELTIPELEEFSKCLKWVDVCKGWNE